ncbi:hypothetical protein FisN_26Lh105 [Fistulifera solaris]|uniref:Uncharacterized protein n=1 Tax=Fistulifera solaris TaxID=1519565 RepID=A0A1Z5KD14_FISSO|nr:hypothetical protein FisN_26Lh105 [Fistulifera solaris]|eukprot:GAX24035.1 hypothetical protein FisN_26Lh105 [Fistulifera solaris]
MDTTLRRYQELDDVSILSGIYTESGDYPPPPPAAAAVDDDDEEFRRALEAEQIRVQREFGVTPPHHQDAISLADESFADVSTIYDNESYMLPQQPSVHESIQIQKNRTPETYDESSFVIDDEGSTILPPNTLFPASPSKQHAPTDPILTPRRLKIVVALLCTIVVASISVAMGSFLAQQRDDDSSLVPNNVQDLDAFATLSPTPSPTESYQWTPENCQDHPSQQFQINDRFREQNCFFLQNHPVHRERLCLPENAGYRWCPATCGLCPIDEESSLEPSVRPSSVPVWLPSLAPSMAATTAEAIPSTPRPTLTPTRNPTPAPVTAPTKPPVPRSTPKPTRKPTPKPTPRPTRSPVQRRTPEPTAEDTPEPTPEPTPPPVQIPDPTRPPRTEDPTPYPTISFVVVTPQPTELVFTPEPTPAPSRPASFLCRTCPLLICELIPC